MFAPVFLLIDLLLLVVMLIGVMTLHVTRFLSGLTKRSTSAEVRWGEAALVNWRVGTWAMPILLDF